MIKGCQKRIIVVKDTGSAYFDSAYFVIKQDLPKGSRESDMLAEANRMVDTYIRDEQAVADPSAHSCASVKHTKKASVLMGIVTSLLSVSLTVIVMLIIN